MKMVIDKKDCTGCTACKNVCPKHCIEMKKNEEGFLYPIINEKECIHCGLCKKTCPVLNGEKNRENNELPKTFIAISKNEQERMTSSSGGIFQIIAKNILEEGGSVCGAYLDNNRELRHILVTNYENIEKLKGSKYLQSDINESFPKIKEILEKQKKVLFVGTACQVAGLYAYLKKDFQNLITCDMICHGVPSPKVFKEYCGLLEKKYKSKIVNYSFRNKDNGWQNYSIKVHFENGKIYQKRFSEDVFMRGFLQNLYLRESCYYCVYKKQKHVSDITLGDFWGIRKYYKNLNDQKGVSVLFFNSQKSLNLLPKLRNDIFIQECTFEEATFDNPMLYDSVKENKNRNSFFEDLNNYDIECALQKNIIKDPIWKIILKKVLYILKIRK